MRFDWGALMRAGLRELGLKPWEFWRLSPAELVMMLGGDAGSRPLDRSSLAHLMAAFPDSKDGER